MNALAPYRLGRVVLHLIAMCADREFAFHCRGVAREFAR